MVYETVNKMYQGLSPLYKVEILPLCLFRLVVVARRKLNAYCLGSVAQSDACPTGDQVAGLHHSLVEIDHEIFSSVILCLQLIREGKLSVTCKRMCTEYWLTA